MGKLVANENMTLNVYQKIVHDIDGVNGGGVQATILTPASTKLTASNAGVYVGDIDVMLPMGIVCLDQYTTTATAKVTIKASGSPTSNGNKLLVVGDKGQVSGVASVAPSGSPPPTSTEDFTVEVIDAGQTKVECT